MKKRIVRKIIFLFIIATFLSFFLEFFIFNNFFQLNGDNKNVTFSSEKFTYEKSKEEVTKQIVNNNNNNNIFYDETDSDEEKSKKINEEKEKINITTLIIKFDKKYVKKIKIDYNTSVDSANSIIYSAFDEYGNPLITADYINFDSNFKYVVKPVNKNVEEIKISLGENKSNILIKKVTILNSFKFNIVRFLFFLFINYSLVLFYIFRKSLEKKLEIFFLIICMGTGIMMIISTPNLLYYSWDDQIHFKNVSNLISDNKYVNSISYKYIMKHRAIRIDIPESIEEYQMVNEFLNKNMNNSDKTISSTNNVNFVSYDEYAYLPSAIVIETCEFFDIPFSISFQLGKFINLIFYSIIGYFTLKNAKYGKNILFIALLVPTNIFLASQYSKDAFIVSLIALGISSFINCYCSNEKVRTKDVLLITLSLLFGSLSKAVYIPISLLLLLLPTKRFQNNKQARITKLIIIGIVIMVLLTFIIPNVLNPSEVGDIRGGNTSLSGQLSLIISQPISFLKLFVPYVLKICTDYFISDVALFAFCNLGIVTGNIYYMLLFLIFLVTLTGEKSEYEITGKLKIYLIALLSIIICFIVGSLYLSFNSVAEISIKGVQERYFLPLLFPFLLIFSTKKITHKFNVKKYNLFIILAISFILYYCIYFQMILPCCQ